MRARTRLPYAGSQYPVIKSQLPETSSQQPENRFDPAACNLLMKALCVSQCVKNALKGTVHEKNRLCRY